MARASAQSSISLPAFLFAVIVSTTASAQTLNVLHNFGFAAGDGNIPYSNLIMDSARNLYGTTLSGGAHNLGAVYELSPNDSGGWNESIIYSFKGVPDGASPHAPLFLDSAGNLYSTTIQGGHESKKCNSTAPAKGCGVIFELTPSGNGAWNESILYTFTGQGDGGNSYAGLIRDKAGNFYGTAASGGTHNFGVAFELSSTGSGWKETVLHSFTGKSDGETPYGGVVFDNAGRLYGTTYQGGSAGWGIVYQLSPSGTDSWTEKILHTFLGKSGNDGAQTFSGVVLDKNGNVFGSTTSGGSFNYGTVFELAAATRYASTILHNFNLGGEDGTFPDGIIFDAHGHIYGATNGGGGNGDGSGIIFSMTPGARGWTEQVLYTFLNSNDGVYPNTSLLRDASGNLYGTTIWGGKAGDTNGGVAFQFVP
jgi:uncharacterized repeat protein (TIGR03803 family)